MKVLVINAGSSSLKYQLLDTNTQDVLAKGLCERIGIGLEDLVSEIIIGPDSTQSVAIFQDYLRDSGLRGLVDKVSLSDCPLRSVML